MKNLLGIALLFVSLIATTAKSGEPTGLLRCNSLSCAGPLFTYCSERTERDGLQSMPADSLSDEDKRALQACQRAAELGLPDAQYMEGLRHSMRAMLIPAHATEEQVKAAELLQAAAEHGHYVAQMMLAQMYLEGKGVPTNRVEAYKWLKLSEWHTGESEALQKLKRAMTANEVARGDALVDAWQAR